MRGGESAGRGKGSEGVERMARARQRREKRRNEDRRRRRRRGQSISSRSQSPVLFEVDGLAAVKIVQQ